MPINNRLFSIILMIILTFSALTMGNPVIAQSYPVILAAPTIETTSQPTPTPAPISNIALNYSEISRASEGVDTRLVLAVNAKYNFGEVITINFQDFILNIAVERGGPPPIQAGDYIFTGTAKPIETRSITIDSSNSEADFQLTFVFSTLQNNAHGQTPFTNYELVHSGITSIASPSPTIPEFPLTITLVAVLAVVTLLLVIGKRKLNFNQ